MLASARSQRKMTRAITDRWISDRVLIIILSKLSHKLGVWVCVSVYVLTWDKWPAGSLYLIQSVAYNDTFSNVRNPFYFLCTERPYYLGLILIGLGSHKSDFYLNCVEERKTNFWIRSPNPNWLTVNNPESFFFLSFYFALKMSVRYFTIVKRIQKTDVSLLAHLS